MRSRYDFRVFGMLFTRAAQPPEHEPPLFHRLSPGIHELADGLILPAAMFIDRQIEVFPHLRPVRVAMEEAHIDKYTIPRLDHLVLFAVLVISGNRDCLRAPDSFGHSLPSCP